MHNFKQLKIWKEGMALASEIIKVSDSFPPEEKFGIVVQLRRAAVSVPGNIAEGTSRSSEKEFRRFIEIALGSCFELETQLLLSVASGYINNEASGNIISRINTLQKMLVGFKNTLNVNQH